MLTRLQAKRKAEDVAVQKTKMTLAVAAKRRTSARHTSTMRTLPRRACAEASRLRQASLLAAQKPEAPIQLPTLVYTLSDLSDLSLQHVFSFLNAQELVKVAQVSRRWRDLCSSRRLWNKQTLRFNEDDEADCLRLVRTLRRMNGMAPYLHLEMECSDWCLPHPRALFEDNAKTLVVTTSSSFALLLCLRELIKPGVSVLKLNDTRMSVTKCEALSIWEAVSKHRGLLEINFCLARFSALFSSSFRWQTRGSVRTVRLSLAPSESITSNLCKPVQSLLSVHKWQLATVHIRPEDQQGLLKECPPTLENLQACLVPTLVPVLRRMVSLWYLFLHTSTHGRDSVKTSREVLGCVLKMRNLHTSVCQLDIVLGSGDRGKAPSDETLLDSLTRFKCLRWVKLKGVCKVLADPVCGGRVLRSLVTGLEGVRALDLCVAPCQLFLNALQGTPNESGEAASTEPSAALRGTVSGGCVVPKALVHLSLSGTCLTSAMLGLPSRGVCCDRVAWTKTLQRLLYRAPWLHVSVDQSQCVVPSHSLLPSKLMIMPHSTMDYCKNCPGGSLKSENYKCVYIADFVKWLLPVP